jgi:hypothetical protein
MDIIPIKPNLNIKTFHIDNLACVSLTARGSVCNWIRIETWVQRMYQINGLTDHEAEYHFCWEFSNTLLPPVGQQSLLIRTRSRAPSTALSRFVIRSPPNCSWKRDS